MNRKPISEFTAKEIKDSLDFLFGSEYQSSSQYNIEKSRRYWISQGKDPPSVQEMVDAGWISLMPKHPPNPPPPGYHYEICDNIRGINYQRVFNPVRYEELTGYQHIPKKKSTEI